MNVVLQVFNISYNGIQGLPPIWMFADNVPSWAEGGIDIRVCSAAAAHLFDTLSAACMLFRIAKVLLQVKSCTQSHIPHGSCRPTK